MLIVRGALARATGVVVCVVGLCVVTGCGKSRDLVSIHPDLLVVSRWYSPPNSQHIEVLSGALASDPHRGFVLVESGRGQPRFFATAARDGSLRLVDGAIGRYGSSFVFRAGDGVTADVDVDQLGAASFYELGRRLDAQHLPALTLHGVAVPVLVGPKRRQAVILVGRSSDGSWIPYGFVSGFELPAASSVDEILHRPLLGPHDRLYRIDPRLRRLVPTASSGRPATSRGPGTGCSIWPQTDRTKYVACSRTIARVERGNVSRTVFRQPSSGVEITWPFLAPSPDGRTLLLEEDFSSCGTHEFADALPLGSGVLLPILGGGQAEPLGWLPFSQWEEALVAGLGNGSEECGSAPDGIYDVYVRPEASSSLIVATNVADATMW
jgi:hypothetical protein